jgi:hypothetical protein
VFGYGTAHWRELPGDERIDGRADALIFTALICCWLATALVLGTVRHDMSWRGLVLVATALFGSIPCACTMMAVRRAAGRADIRTDAEQVAWLIERRRLLRGLLAAVGSLVALSTLALGASVQLQQKLLETHQIDPSHVVPPQTVVVFGGVGSLVVALGYGPAASELTRRGRELCTQLFDISQAPDGPTLLSRLDDRHKLEMLLGADSGSFTDLQSGLVVLAPLLASASSFLLPR